MEPRTGIEPATSSCLVHLMEYKAVTLPLSYRGTLVQVRRYSFLTVAASQIVIAHLSTEMVEVWGDASFGLR